MLYILSMEPRQAGSSREPVTAAAGRPQRVTGRTARYGAVAAACPLAVEAGLEILSAGGGAVDAAIAAQAMIAVVDPAAAGPGGDVLALVRSGGSAVEAIAGTGCTPAVVPTHGWATTGGRSLTVPGLVDGWLTLHERNGILPLADVLAPAVQVARDGYVLDARLVASVQAHRTRLLTGGAREWPLLSLEVGERWRQPELARLLEQIAASGRDAFYDGAIGRALVAASALDGGALSLDDLAAHKTLIAEPVGVDWAGLRVWVQPPPSQAVLLAMVLAELEQRRVDGDPAADDHLLIELTGAAFEYRADALRGAALVGTPLATTETAATRARGPRSYLHTAGVAVADRSGCVVSSLVSVFDDFGSGVFVPAGGFVLNNRAGGFTDGANAAAPAKRPVHTLSPVLVQDGEDLTALATPGADGQVQTLLQVLTRQHTGGASLAQALRAPRWRSQDGTLLIESGHRSTEVLESRGHRVRERPAGEDLFGAVVAAGVGCEPDGTMVPHAETDGRRNTAAGVR